MIRLDDTLPIAEWLAHRALELMREGDVLFHAPSQVFQAPGGGENQLVQTARALEQAGVGVRLFSRWTDRIDRAKCLHLFGMSREGLELARVARSLSIPIVLSPISWHEPRAIAALATSNAAKYRDLVKWGVKLAFPKAKSWRRELLTTADAVLPNSRAEADQLTRLFGVDRETIYVVPNGVDARFAEGTPELFRDRTGVDGDFVLFVGRIEPRKNVLGLIIAAALADLPLVVIGNAPPAHTAYFEQCRQAATPSTRFLPAIDHDDPLLSSAYSAARVFALPSWFETPGLAALEAGLAGCSLVLTPNGCTKEYFGESALYPTTGNRAELVGALETAWQMPNDPQLADRILNRYLWSDVARRTAEVYETLAQ